MTAGAQSGCQTDGGVVRNGTVRILMSRCGARTVPSEWSWPKVIVPLSNDHRSFGGGAVEVVVVHPVGDGGQLAVGQPVCGVSV